MLQRSMFQELPMRLTKRKLKEGEQTVILKFSIPGPQGLFKKKREIGQYNLIPCGFPYATFFLKVQYISENLIFFSFLYVLLSCSHFLLFSVFLSSKPSQSLLLLPPAPSSSPSYFTSPSNFPNVHLWTVDQNSWRKYDFLFQEVRQKWQGIDLIKICVISNYRFIWVQKKEERLALEVRIISWGRLYFCFINNKQRDFPDCPVVKVVKTQRFQCRRHGIDPWSGN